MSDEHRTQDYHDAELRIGDLTDAGYPVEITLDGNRHWCGHLPSEVSQWATSRDLEADGKWLAAELLCDQELLEGWTMIREVAPQCRWRLRVDTTELEIHQLPWEALCDRGIILAADANTPFSRYTALPSSLGAAVEKWPIRLLIVIANPVDLAAHGRCPLDPRAEQKAIEQALAEFPRVKATFLEPPATLARIQKAARDEYQVLHIIAHGGVGQRDGEPYLMLENEDGTSAPATAENLAGVLTYLANPPHLVVLAACDSGTPASNSPLSSLASKLVHSRTNAVLAMQGKVTVASARNFASVFYERLATHGCVDLATNEARGALYTNRRTDAAVPTLHMRLDDGLLWRVPGRHDSYPNVVDHPSHHQKIIRGGLIPSKPPGFLGREAEVTRVCKLLHQQSLVAITGRPGIGKTALAGKVVDDLTRPDSDELAAIVGFTGLYSSNLDDIQRELDGTLKDVQASLHTRSSVSILWRADMSGTEKARCLLAAIQQVYRLTSRYMLLVFDALQVDCAGRLPDEEISMLLRAIRDYGDNSGVKAICLTRMEITLDGSLLCPEPIVLQGLKEAVATEFLKRKLSEHSIEPAGYGRWVSYANGNPKILECMVRLIGETRDIDGSEVKRSLRDDADAAEWVEATIAGLSGDGATLCKLLSVLSEPVTAADLGVIAERVSALAEAGTSSTPGMIKRMPGHLLQRLHTYSYLQYDQGHGTYQMHDVDREVWRKNMSDVDAKTMHRGIADYYALRNADLWKKLINAESTESYESVDPDAFIVEFRHRIGAGEYARGHLLFSRAEELLLQKRGYYREIRDARSMLVDRLGEYAELDADNLCSLGRAHRFLGQFVKAEEYIRRALWIAEKAIGDSWRAGIYRGELGSVYRNTEQFPEAIEQYKEALKAVHRKECLQRGRLGIIFRAQRKILASIACHSEALKMSKESNDTREKCVQLGCLGLSYRSLGLLGEALEHHYEAYAIAAEIQDLWEIEYNLGHLGLVYHDLGRDDWAMRMYLRSWDIARRIGDRRGEHIRLSCIAYLGYYQGEYDVASTLYAFTRNVYGEELRERLGESYCRLGLGRVAIARRNFSEADTILVSHLASRNGSNTSVLETGYQTAYSLALSRFLNGNSKGSLDAFQECIRLCRELIELNEESSEELSKLNAESSEDLPDSAKGRKPIDPLYAMAAAELGMAEICRAEEESDTGKQHYENAVQVFEEALSMCSASGVLEDVIRDLDWMRSVRQCSDLTPNVINLLRTHMDSKCSLSPDQLARIESDPLLAPPYSSIVSRLGATIDCLDKKQLVESLQRVCQKLKIDTIDRRDAME